MNVTKLTNVDFDKIVMLGIEEVFGFSRATGELRFAFDQVKSGELGGNNDVTYAEGKRGVRLATLKNNKTSTFSCENGYVIASALATQLGSEVEIGTEENKIKVRRAEHVVLGEDGTSLKMSATPVANSMKFVYLCNSDMTKKEAIDGFTVEGDVATLNAAGVAGETYLCIYDEEVAVAKRIVNDGETFAEDVELVINMLGQDICSGVQYLVQCVMPKASVSGEWNFSLGNDPAVHNFSAEAMLDVCSTTKELCEFIIC